MLKVYAKQIPPEYQESPLCIDECFPAGVVFTGNRDYQEHTIEAWNKLSNVEEIPGHVGPDSWYRNITEALNDLVPRDDGKGYTTKQVHAWKQLLEDWDWYDDDCKTEALALITGKRYDTKTLHGCCQSDWVDVFYPVDEWDRDALQRLETEYFNMGTEWIIHDEEQAPEGPENISGYSLYCYGWNTDQIKQEIAENTGATTENIQLYEFSGYTKTPEWRAV